MNTKRITVALAALAALVTATPAEAAQKPPPSSQTGVIWDNSYTFTGVWGISSNDYLDYPYDSHDTEAADDFVLKGARTIAEIDVKGFYNANRDPLSGGPSLSSGPAESVTVRFYASTVDADGTPVPGVEVAPAQTVVPHGVQYGEELAIVLANPVRLPGGHYWVSVTANINYTLHGAWHWDDAWGHREHPSVWRQPSNAGRSGCGSWCTLDEAFPSTPAGPDLSFRLIGASS